MIQLESADPRTSIEEAFDLTIEVVEYEDSSGYSETAHVVRNVTLEEVFDSCDNGIVVSEPSGYDHPDAEYTITAYNYYIE